MSIKDKANFNYVLFEDGKKILFGIEDLSKVSFMNTDITRVRFNDRARWGKRDKFKVLEEEILEEFLEGKNPILSPSLGSVMAVYRNLRENYEFRLRYDEAGQFFFKEMELKKKHREEETNSGQERTVVIKRNGWFRRHFSLTGLYYHFSKYGESILRPTVIGVIIVGLSTLFWLFQNYPTAEPSLFASSILHVTKTVHNHINVNQMPKTVHNYINATQILNNTHTLKAFERSLGDFLPTLSLSSDIKVSIIDYVVNIVGGALTFVLLAVALRRKFERKYTR